ncbi:MAG: type II toxin-antitoxin system RelE/ParE family toxin [Patescibacteria group bacterium]
MKVSLSDMAEKQYAKLPKSDRQKIDRKIELLQIKPQSGKKLKGELSDGYSLKAWPYRIIYHIDTFKKIVWITSILHRQRAYK